MTLYQINAALQRVRYSSMMKQKEIHLFPNELCASYPSSFVENQFRTFFYEHISLSSSSPFTPHITDEKLLHKLKFRQTQVANTTIRTNLDTNQFIEDRSSWSSSSWSALKITRRSIGRKPIVHDNQLIIHYTHEKRFNSFKSDMYQIYDSVFRTAIFDDVRLIVDNSNRPSAYHRLIRKRPKQSLLKNVLHMLQLFLLFLGRLLLQISYYSFLERKSKNNPRNQSKEKNQNISNIKKTWSLKKHRRICK